MNRLVLLVVLALGCSADLTSSNPYAGRTYRRTTCPRPPMNVISMCDRGDGQTPRFVTLDECVAEVGGTLGGVHGWNSTHPQRPECLSTAGVGLSTIEDIWRAFVAR